MDAPSPKKPHGNTGKRAGNAGKGRPKGVPNKLGKEIKDMVLAALEKAGGTDYLLEQAYANPVAFMGLVGKVLPIQVNAAHSGNVAHVHQIHIVGIEP